MYTRQKNIMEKNNTDDVSHLFKPGYEFKVEKYDFESSEIKKEIENAHRLQQECKDRKIIDPESLQRIMTI